MKTTRLTTAQALIRFLQAQYSERDGERQRVIPAIFGIFGHGNVLGVGQAIQQEGRELPLYQPKSEQAMVHTAIGYAKAARRLSTLACTASIGPGSTNMLTGAATATTNRLPVLLLPSDTFANRRQGPVLQQLEHPLEGDATVNDAFRPLSRFFDRISRPEQLLTALPEAMRVLLDPASGGAVTISLPQDVQGEAFDYPAEFFAERTWPVVRRPAAASEIDDVARLIRGSRRPLVIAGGGVRYSAAEAELLEFCESLSIPVAETSAGKGSVAESEWLLGGIGVNGTRAAAEVAAAADLVLCVGTRLGDFTTGSHSLFQHPGVRFASINVDPLDAAKLGAASVVADARESLRALRTAAGTPTRLEYATSVARRIDSWQREMGEHLDSAAGSPPGQAACLAAINGSVEAGDWIVAAAGWQPGDLLKSWRTPAGSFTHIEFAFSCMGHEIPAGLGIRLRERDGEVIVVIGDGTYLINPTELVTAVQEGLKLTVVVLDNGGYQSIQALAVGNTGSGAGNEFRHREPGANLPTGDRVQVDYVANARSMGLRSVLAETVEDLEGALAAARAGEDSTVIVCPTAPGAALPASGAFWDLGVPEAARSPETRQLVAEFEARRGGVQRPYVRPSGVREES